MHAFYVLTVLEQMNAAKQHLFAWLQFIHHMHRAVYTRTQYLYCLLFLSQPKLDNGYLSDRLGYQALHPS